jgi:hypothetical protein
VPYSISFLRDELLTRYASSLWVAYAFDCLLLLDILIKLNTTFTDASSSVQVGICTHVRLYTYECMSTSNHTPPKMRPHLARRTSAAASPDVCVCLNQSPPTHPPTHPPSNPATHLPTHTHPPTDPPTHPPTHPPQVRDRVRIRNRYLTTEFPIDIVGVTPLDIFARYTGESGPMVAFLRVPKLVCACVCVCVVRP